MSAEPVVETGELLRRHEELSRRYAAELTFGKLLASGAGLTALVDVIGQLGRSCAWLLDPHGRVVTQAVDAHPAELRTPDLNALLAAIGPVDPGQSRPSLVPARPDQGLSRRHLVCPVARGDRLFAWLVVAEVPARFTPFHSALVHSAARHLAIELATQERVARVAWSARATLARQLVRGSVAGVDLDASAEYLGVDVRADRVIAFLTNLEAHLDPEGIERLSDQVAKALGVDVLAARGNEGVLLLVEAPADVAPVVMVGQVKRVIAKVLAAGGESHAIAGVSAVARVREFNRAYREAREVASCVDRFGAPGTRIISVDDLGPARLFVAHGNLESVTRYVEDILGSLLEDGPGIADLLRTLQVFFDTGRSVRESAAILGVHENTVRLRLAKVHDLTGLDVASSATDQLSAQTALLVLKLQGHPALPDAGESAGHEE